jgi:5-oxoprolinase (ATP-hydrolysing)/N-methylhydantoinase B
MRFSDRRYYVEAYVKCANCGVLVYDEGLKGGDGTLYCSDWCRAWAAARDGGNPRPGVPLPRVARPAEE